MLCWLIYGRMGFIDRGQQRTTQKKKGTLQKKKILLEVHARSHAWHDIRVV
jgi:hypothetical protein